MEKKYIKIPLIVYTNKMSEEGNKVLKDIIKILNKLSIPYVFYENGKYTFISNGIKYKITNYCDIFFISDFALVIESNYSKNAVEIVDSMLNQGRDILCFPSSICNKNAFFSNNLIRDGAFCITSLHMFTEYLLS